MAASSCEVGEGDRSGELNGRLACCVDRFGGLVDGGADAADLVAGLDELEEHAPPR